MKSAVRDILLVSRREFRERVASRSFVLGTLLFPVLMAGLILLPRLGGSGGTEWTLAVVHEGQSELVSAFATALGAEARSESDNTYRVLPVAGSFSELRERLNARVEAREIDGYVVFPADVLEGRPVLFRARTIGSPAVMRDLRNAGNLAIQSERLRMAGMGPSDLAELVAPVQIDPARITARGEERTGGLGAFLAAVVLAFLIYFMTTLYGVAVLHSVLEEKTSRTAEVLMSTVRASHVMAGKIMGVGSAAVAQVLVWVSLTAIAIALSSWFGPSFGIPEPVAQALQVEPLTGVLMFLFFLLGFFLYASVFAIVGASVTSQQEAQSVQVVALLPLMAPLLFLPSILNAPLGATARTLGLVPFSAPIAMPMRLASVPLPWIEIGASLASLVCGIAAVTWAAGKIYRVGVLSTGQRPSLGELWRWVRSA
jgi:ABC-2 type transport system permease protein